MRKINFFTNILKFIKSNAIAVFDNTSLISQSGGQTSRIDSLENCLYKLNLKARKKENIKFIFIFRCFFPFHRLFGIYKKQINLKLIYMRRWDQ